MGDTKIEKQTVCQLVCLLYIAVLISTSFVARQDLKDIQTTMLRQRFDSSLAANSLVKAVIRST